MTETIHELLTRYDNTQYATGVGVRRHKLLQGIVVASDGIHGDAEMVAQIKSHPELARFFTPNSRAELPIAGVVLGRFISRRIDRLVIDDKTKTVYILDYKTDIDKDKMREHYCYKMREYKELLRQVYTDYNIETYILWLHDWTLQEIK
ncbi:MAG: hypothetical protein IJ560_04335 [Alphaproteobacteria bacterium]|nr:hypothetical protein [Alphaproteobacteria bacterium]